MLFIFSCSKNSSLEIEDTPYVIQYPQGFPAMTLPAGKELTVFRVQLGRQLFFDKRLSRDSSVSCGSCHSQQHAFADFNALSKGVNNAVGFRNSPTLANLGYHPYLFRDGGATTLETQILAPIEDEREMNFSIPEAVARMKKIKGYNELAQKAYQRDFDVYVLTRAIAAFERTLISGNSRYDQYKNGKTSVLNASEKRGMDLFFSNKTQCSQCHSGFDFTDYDFKNIGLFETYADSGRERITLIPADKGKFKTPTLRNIAVTAPYMHDGCLNTLEEVIEHFNLGGKNHPNKDDLIKPLNLTQQEKTDLVNFMKSLTDETFLNNQAFSP
jgi:cytochrome c peroxidase